jgi:hypothetical protein
MFRKRIVEKKGNLITLPLKECRKLAPVVQRSGLETVRAEQGKYGEPEKPL